MTNVLAIILVTLVTNVTNVQVPDPSSGFRVPPVLRSRGSTAEGGGSELGQLIRVETTEVLETSTITFEWEGISRAVAFHNRVVSRTVRKFKTKLVEEEVK
jgi:hypothetical protein